MIGMPPIMQEYYGDETRWFIGTVIDNSPPAGQEGMVRVRIRGIHSDNVNDIPQADLPWASVVIPGTEPGISGLGLVPQIMSGAQVFGIFMDGKASQIPLVLGTIAHNEYPTSIQAAGRDDIVTNPSVYEFNQQIDLVQPALPGPENGDITLRAKRTIIAKFFIDNGFTAEQAAGVAGTLDTISGLDPLYNNDNGLGIAAWPSIGFRFQKLIDFADTLDNTYSWFDFTTQLLFILHEFRTSQKVCNAKLRNSVSIGEASELGRYGPGSVNVFINNYLTKKVAQAVKVGSCVASAESIYEIITE